MSSKITDDGADAQFEYLNKRGDYPYSYPKNNREVIKEKPAAKNSWVKP